MGGARLAEDESKIKARAFLIGQLGKNQSIVNNPVNLGILLNEVYPFVLQARKLIGGRAIILECEDNNKLVSLYEKHGFTKVNMPPNHRGDVTLYTIIKD